MTELARMTDPATSHEAAASTDKARTRAAVERALQAVIFGTDEDIATIVLTLNPGIAPSGIRTRRKELVDDGLVVATEQEGRTATGSRATVWAWAEAWCTACDAQSPCLCERREWQTEQAINDAEGEAREEWPENWGGQ